MSGSDYLYLSAAAVIFVLILALVTRKAPAPPEAPQETTRWKRFRFAWGPLHGVLGEATAAIVEDPGGLELVALPRDDALARRVVLSRDGKRHDIEIVRGKLFSKRKLRVLVGGKEWLTALVPRRGEPQPELQLATPGESWELHGNVAGREYEVRRGDKLVASISWQGSADDESEPGEYVLEVLKEEDPLPLVALAAAVEVAMGPVTAESPATASARSS